MPKPSISRGVLAQPARVVKPDVDVTVNFLAVVALRSGKELGVTYVDHFASEQDMGAHDTEEMLKKQLPCDLGLNKFASDKT